MSAVIRITEKYVRGVCESLESHWMTKYESHVKNDSIEAYFFALFEENLISEKDFEKALDIASKLI